MSDRSKIEWCDTTWNPISGCTKISQGCKNCYAAELHNRRYKAYMRGAKLPEQYAKPFGEIQLHEDRLEMPLHWKKPRRIFVNSTSDLFHEDVPDEFIWKVFSVMAAAENHTFLILTKRPERMDDYLCQWEFNFPVLYQTDTILHSWPLPNVWLGVSVENQAAADERIPLLLKTPAAVRFVSVEPMLEKVDLTRVHDETTHTYFDVLGGSRFDYGLDGHGIASPTRNKINWVICGGESGSGARPMHPDWARSLRDQCRLADIPFFFKQWGEWSSDYPQGRNLANTEMTYADGMTYYRLGKKNTGRLLDGREWDEYPGGEG